MTGVRTSSSRARQLDFWVKIEEGVKALLQLSLDLFARSFQDVHGHVCLVAISQLQRCVLDFDHFALRQKAHSVDKSQICHVHHLIYSGSCEDA